MENITTLAPVALLSFGATWIVSFLISKYTKVVFDTQAKVALNVVFAFIFLFIPVEFQNELANKVRDAVAVAVGTISIYQGAKQIRG